MTENEPKLGGKETRVFGASRGIGKKQCDGVTLYCGATYLVCLSPMVTQEIPLNRTLASGFATALQMPAWDYTRT